MPRPVDRQSGFTLVEVLAGLTLLSLAAGMTAAGLGLSNRVRDRETQRHDAIETVAAAESVLRQRLERADPVRLFGGAASLVDFAGTARSVAFLAPPPATVGAGAPRRTTLSLGADGSLRLSDSADTPRHKPRPVHADILLRGVQGLSIAYYGSAPPDGTPRWRDTWRMRQSLPTLIRVRVHFPPGDRRWWPDLIVAPGATIESRCVQTGATGRCRGR